MADEKKPAPKEAPPKDDPFVEIVSLLAVVMFVMYVITGITNFITTNEMVSRGWKGFTPHGIILSHTIPISELENPIDAKVISINDTEVYNSPEGEKVGEQKQYARGVILQGPVTIDDTVYWYVDYETDPDGWVKETDIRHLVSEPNLLERIILGAFTTFWYIKIIVIVISIICFIYIVYLFRKINELRATEDKLLYPESAKIASSHSPEWERILNHIESLNENDWRSAIIEADIMLGDILDKLSLPGDTIGEKLKAVEKSDFTTVDKAWEAHKVRNQVAHEGQSFALNQRQAKAVIELYRAVFEEFQII